MSRTIQLADDVDASIQAHLAARGRGELSEYVNRAVRRQLLRDTIQTIRHRNADADPATIEDEINQTLKEVRADRP